MWLAQKLKLMESGFNECPVAIPHEIITRSKSGKISKHKTKNQKSFASKQPSVAIIKLNNAVSLHYTFTLDSLLSY